MAGCAPGPRGSSHAGEAGGPPGQQLLRSRPWVFAGGACQLPAGAMWVAAAAAAAAAPSCNCRRSRLASASSAARSASRRLTSRACTRHVYKLSPLYSLQESTGAVSPDNLQVTDTLQPPPVPFHPTPVEAGQAPAPPCCSCAASSAAAPRAQPRSLRRGRRRWRTLLVLTLRPGKPGKHLWPSPCAGGEQRIRKNVV